MKTQLKKDVEKFKCFTIKEKSVIEFLTKWLAVSDENDHHRRNSDTLNIIGKDEILVKKDLMSVIDRDPYILFEVTDYASKSRKHLINTYYYSIEKYDDVCLLLELIYSEVKFIDDKQVSGLSVDNPFYPMP